MKGRIFSTFLLWTILAATAFFFKAEGALLLVTAAAFLTQRELYRMLKEKGLQPLSATGLAIGLAVSLSPILQIPEILHGLGIVAPALLIFAILAILLRKCGEITSTISSSLTGLILAPCTMVFISMMIYHFGPENKGLIMALWLVMTTKFTDMGALLTGLAIGRHKMSPTLSPKKTWEGAVGGTLLCVISSWVFARYCAEWLPTGFTPLLAALLALPIAIAGIFADLLESAFKRESGFKDSGKIIPGIGGVFDLTDSFMLTAPLAYYMTTIILG